MDLVSVIVPVYNVEKYLRACLDSILQQTYSDLEILVVDDGSTDACPEICEEYARKDSRIQVIHRQNGGLSDARNTGIDAASGAYLFFVDADDFLLPDAIGELLCEAKKTDSDIVLCNYNIVDEAGGICHASAVAGQDIWPPEKFWEVYYGKDSVFCVVAWNKLYKRDVFQTLRFPAGKYHEDEYLLHSLLAACHYVSMTDKRLYCYRQRSDGITGSYDAEKDFDRLEAYCMRNAYALKNKQRMLALRTLPFILSELISLHDRMGRDALRKLPRYLSLKREFCRQVSHSMRRGYLRVRDWKLLLFCMNERLYLWLRACKRRK